jgi:hypothetical protein
VVAVRILEELALQRRGHASLQVDRHERVLRPSKLSCKASARRCECEVEAKRRRDSRLERSGNTPALVLWEWSEMVEAHHLTHRDNVRSHIEDRLTQMTPNGACGGRPF